MIGGVYLHFLYFWNITRGYEFINLRIEDLLPAIEPLTRRQIREIHHLWALHAHLERISMRLKRSCGLQLLAMRLEYFLHCIILCFVVIAIPQRASPPNAATYFLSFICCVRSLEIFIIDYLLETMSTYHSKPMDAVIEGRMCKELGAFIIYGRSMELNLKLCGMYLPNRTSFLHMAEGILCHFMLLLQFLLIFSN
ncbi:putative gustatory receptor 59b [Drosophila mauritiana]|uniref:Gustatory receptor 59b n=1 Tax=Drosophila mauritiana TaxID=7226 RepID=A0A6P8JK57_DROMA|nr:putative gustatory receptor 59b [Drosophila mauritiana]